MTQTTAYENRYVIPALHRHLLLNSGKGSKQETYTEEEKRLREILSKANSETIIGLAIRKRLSHRDVGAFRKMIVELQEQLRDCGRERMIEVLGIDAVKLLETISSN
jgi:hypothetical protein